MATASDSAATTMAFWKPGMPVKAFDPFSIERLNADLADGSITEFPIEEYKEYLIQQARVDAIKQGTQDFTIEPHEDHRPVLSQHRYYDHVEDYIEINSVSSITYIGTARIAWVVYEKFDPYALKPPSPNSAFHLLQIHISVVDKTGFIKPIDVRFEYEIKWIDKPVVYDDDYYLHYDHYNPPDD